ncbi:MAG: hypothetical protein IMX00_00375 [Limnochordales bacterium]|nr:hypothetical protein [Limnochordales bacterium]
MSCARRTGAVASLLAALGVLLVVAIAIGPGAESVRAAASASSAGAESISDAWSLVQKALAYAQEIKDARLTVTVSQFDPATGREVARMRGKLAATVKPPVLRLEFVEPTALAGQLVIVDGEKQQVYIYSPVTEQVMVQPIQQAAAMAGVSLPLTAAGSGDGSIDINKLLQLPATRDEKNYTVTLVRFEKWMGSEAGVVDITSRELPGRQRLWIVRSTGQVGQVESYDQQERLVVRTIIESLQRNVGLQATLLLKLPAGARVAP